MAAMNRDKSGPSDWPVVTACIETAMYNGTSAHPVTYGVAGDGGQHYGGDGRKVGYLSGASRDPDAPAWRERNPGKTPMTCLWLRLDPAALAELPGVREAVLASLDRVASTGGPDV